MGVYGALLTGVLGLQGQSTKMGAISDNIANVNTVGFKRADVQFQTLVTESISSTNYQPGGVLSRPRQLVDVQGTISNSASTTDLAISGRGFFVVSDETIASADTERLYTRAGSFREAIDPDDASKALLKNVSGHYLMGWKVDKTGELEVTQTSSALEVFNTRRFEQSAEPTETVAWRANLPAEVVASGASLSYYVNQTQTKTVTAADGQTRTAQQTDPVRAAFTAARNGDPAVVTVTLPAGANTPVMTVVLGGTTVNFTVADITGGAYTSLAAVQTEVANAVNAFAFPGSVPPAVLATLRADILADADVQAAITNGFNTNQTPAALAAAIVAAADGTNPANGAVANYLPADNAGLTAAITGTLPTAQTAGTATGGGAAFVDGGSLTSFVTRINGLNKSGYTMSAAIDSNGYLSISAATATGNQTAQITTADFTLGGVVADPTLAAGVTQTVGTTTDLGTGIGTVFTADFTTTQVIYDALGSSREVKYQWKKRLDEPNLWEVRLTDEGVSGLVGQFDPSAPTGTNNGARFMVTDGSQTFQTQRLFMKFTGDGALQEVRLDSDGTGTGKSTTLEGQSTLGIVANREGDSTKTPKLVSVAIGPVDLTGATTDALATAASIGTNTPGFVDPETPNSIVYEWDLGKPTITYGPSNQTASVGGTGLDAITQFSSGEASPVIETFFYNQDGARVGQLDGLVVDEEGFLLATYNNGLTRKIYRLPVVTFANPNGLINKSGNVYGESEKSGTAQFNFALDGGSGRIIGSSLENSNVDLGEEFTNMIITQQAFTANTRTITTADQMLQEMVGILR